jgi:hypothetical protein
VARKTRPRLIVDEPSDDAERDSRPPSPDLDQLQLKLSPSSPMRAVAAAIANRENVDAGQEGHPTYVYQQRTSPEKITAEQFLRFIREAPETTGDALIIALDNWRQRSSALHRRGSRIAIPIPHSRLPERTLRGFPKDPKQAA